MDEIKRVPQPHERMVLPVIWLLFGASLASAAVIIILDLQAMRTQVPEKHPVHNEIIFDGKDSTGMLIAHFEDRELEPREKFELWMSLGRRPRWSSQALVVLVTFLLTSQYLLLWYLPHYRWRWHIYAAVIILGLVWMSFQVTNWLERFHVSFMSKAFGEPIGLLAVPALGFLIIDRKWGGSLTIETLLLAIMIEASCFIPWLIAWGLMQLFILRWVWI